MINLQPFAEKYKPLKTSDLVLDNNLREKINHIIETKNIPNIILTGKSGSGKTATIHALRNELYPKVTSSQILEINASDSRGINVVNNDIIGFCRTCTEYKEGYAQHKLLIIDEVDNLTAKPQKLICSIMDQYPNVHFVFTCNIISKIIPSIISRCSKYDYNILPEDFVIEKLKKVCLLENIQYDNEKTLLYLYKYNESNIRQSLNVLELVNQVTKKITIDNIKSVCDIPSNEQFKKIITAINTKNYKSLCSTIKELCDTGYYAVDIVTHFVQYLKNDVECENKMIILECLATSAFNMSSNTSNYLQLTSAFLTSYSPRDLLRNSHS